jgi:tetratricopeptide (TPR) repeat protein
LTLSSHSTISILDTVLLFDHRALHRAETAALIGQQRAVALNPSAPLARHFLACVHEFSQRPAEAIPHIEALLRLDPRYRFASLALADQALCRFLLGELEQARVDAERAARLQLTNVRARQRLIAVLTELGHTKAAQQSAEERERFIGALQAAGLPLD